MYIRGSLFWVASDVVGVFRIYIPHCCDKRLQAILLEWSRLDYSLPFHCGEKYQRESSERELGEKERVRVKMKERPQANRGVTLASDPE